MIYKTFFLSFAILFILIGCSNSNQNDNSNSDKAASQQKKVTVDSNVIKVYVERDGKITANGNVISLKDLDSSFSKLKTSNGIVYYSRANPEGKPPQESMKVMDLIIKYSLPVKLYTDKTFSVVIKQN